MVPMIRREQPLWAIDIYGMSTGDRIKHQVELRGRARNSPAFFFRMSTCCIEPFGWKVHVTAIIVEN